MVRPAPPFRFVDLFAGIGGFHHALAGLGGECVWACEIDPECRTVYRTSFPDLSEDRFPADIRSVTLDERGKPRSSPELASRVPDHDVLCAGFPCQPFSKSGAQLGVRDRTRGTLFFDIMEIVRAKRPRFVLLENVRNLSGPRHRETWSLVVESLREAGYAVAGEPMVLTPHLIPPDQGGAPQVRDRVYVAATRAADPGVEPAPLLSRRAFPQWDPDGWRISDHVVPDSRIPNVERYRLSDREKTWIAAWEALVRGIPDDRLPGFPLWAFAFRARASIPEAAPAWEAAFLRKNAVFYRENREFLDGWLRRTWGPDRQTVLEFPLSRQKLEWQARKAHPTREGRTLSDLVLQLRPSGIRVKPPTYLPALVAITQTSVVGPGVAPGLRDYRRLTPREAAVLQGIPSDTFERAGVPDKTAYRQLGNAVNVGVARLVASALLTASGDGRDAGPLSSPRLRAAQRRLALA